MDKPIAITPGDPAGIGPEIIAKAFRDAPERTRGCFVAGDVGVMRRAAQFLLRAGQTDLPVAVLERPSDALDMAPRCIPVLQIGPPAPCVAIGRVSAAAGAMAAQSVLWAADAALRAELAAMVTAPLNKAALCAAGAPHSAFPGHTEMLQARAAAFLGKPLAELPVRMMLANDELCTVLLSIHVSLRDAIDAVTHDNLRRRCRWPIPPCVPCLAARRALRWRASTRMPVKAVCLAGKKSNRLRLLLPAPARAGSMCTGRWRPIPFSCARARAAAVMASSMGSWPCTTFRG